MQQLNKNPKEWELWDLRFHSWIENSGLGGDLWDLLGLWDTDMSRYFIFRELLVKHSEFLRLLQKNQ